MNEKNKDAKEILEEIQRNKIIALIPTKHQWIIKELEIPTAKTLWDLETLCRKKPTPTIIFFQNNEKIPRSSILNMLPQKPETLLIPEG